MSLRRKYLAVLGRIVPAGAVSAWLLLGSTAPGAAREQPAGLQPTASDQAGVSERLAAIRQAVSDVAGRNRDASAGGVQLAWANFGWRNGGWGWRNGGWRNGGWRNVAWGNGWHNGGWRNGWPNFWRNW